MIVTEGESETNETQATGRVARVTKGGQKAGKGIVSSGRGAITNRRLLWRAAAAQHSRSRAETAPRNMFRPVAETLAFNPDPGIAAGAGIGSALKAITGASKISLAGERSGIMCDFANRIAAARATARPQDLPGILRTIKEQRQAALATAARNAARESSEKRQAVLQGGQAQRPGRSNRPDPHKPKK